MDSNFSSDFFSGNRKELRRRLGDDAPIIISANGLVQRNSDINYPFRQDSNFWYLTGIEDPDLILVLDGDEEFLIAPWRDEMRLAFDGQIDSDKNTRISGVKVVLDEKEGMQKLTNRLKKLKYTYVIKPPDKFDKHHGIFTNPARGVLYSQLKEINPKMELVDIRKQFAHLRMIKQPEELVAIKRAVEITVDTFKDVQKEIAKYDNEYQIQHYFNQEFSRAHSSHAYQPIVASGKSACTLHYIDNDQDITENELVLIDAGAEWHNYASDITRTYARGSVNDRQRSVYDAVVEVQNFAMSILRPGVILKDYEQKVEKFMGQKLKQLDLINTINHKNVRKYYPHATSHFLGLDTHDSGDYQQPLRSGMVLTVEPGIYLPEESIGIRIEDDVLITDSGVENLSSNLPRDLV